MSPLRGEPNVLVDVRTPDDSSLEFTVDVITINHTYVVIRARGTLTTCTLGLLEALVDQRTQAGDAVRIDLSGVIVGETDLDTQLVGFRRALDMRGFRFIGPAEPTPEPHEDEVLALVC